MDTIFFAFYATIMMFGSADMKSSESSGDTYVLQQNAFFIKSISKTYIMSSILSMFFLHAGSLVDTLIVGAYLGEQGLAAMSLVGPVYLIFYTFGAVIGIGGSIHASRVLGQDDCVEYEKVFTCSTIIMVTTAIAITAMAYVFLPDIIAFLCKGVDKVQQDMVRDYLVFYIPGGALNMIAYIPLYFSRTDGKPKLSSRLFSLSAIVNVVLSLLFVSPVCGMGTGGIALATSISMLIVVLAGFIVLLGKSSQLHFIHNSLQGERIRMMIAAGLPNGFSNLLRSARIYLINFLIIGIGAGYLLSCYTVVQSVMSSMNTVVMGLAYAFVPLFGVFTGERDYSGLRAIMKHALKTGLLIMIPLTILVCLLGKPLFQFFGITDTAIINEGRRAVPLACIGLITAYVNMLNSNYLTAIKHENLALLLVSLRLFVVLAVFAIPLSAVAGSTGIWASFSLAEVFSLLIYIGIRSVLQHRNPDLDKYLIDKSKEPIGDISFSVRNQVDDIVKASRHIADFCRDQNITSKQTTKVSLAIEEILTYLTAHCINTDKEIFIDVRVSKQDDDVLLRFRYVDKTFDLKAYYDKNEEYEEMKDELLGLKIIDKSSKYFEFKQTLGCNNIVIIV